jgi:Na+/H+-dicarboxylate symporter
VLDRAVPWRAKSPVRLVLRLAVLVMVGLAAYVVASEGLQGLRALLPILGAHVLVLLVLYPLWLRYRRKRRDRGGGSQ